MAYTKEKLRVRRCLLFVKTFYIQRCCTHDIQRHWAPHRKKLRNNLKKEIMEIALGAYSAKIHHRLRRAPGLWTKAKLLGRKMVLFDTSDRKKAQPATKHCYREGWQKENKGGEKASKITSIPNGDGVQEEHKYRSKVSCEVTSVAISLVWNKNKAVRTARNRWYIGTFFVPARNVADQEYLIAKYAAETLRFVLLKLEWTQNEANEVTKAM